MGDLQFRSLETYSQQFLYEAFVDAFSDYSVPMTLSLEEFSVMHTRRGISYEASLGAFDGDKLAGFVFNGDGLHLGVRTAYDGGTGVATTHRGQGLSKQLAAKTAAHLRGMGFTRWLLEVLTDNEKAIRTYSGAGFAVTRKFRCYTGTVDGAAERSEKAAARAGIALARVATFDPVKAAGFRDWEPSWQNSDASIARNPQPLVILEAKRQGRPAGMAVATKSGSVCQISVRKEFRKQGIGTALAAGLAAANPSGTLRYVNVLDEDSGTCRLLESLGLTVECDQFEMMSHL